MQTPRSCPLCACGNRLTQWQAQTHGVDAFISDLHEETLQVVVVGGKERHGVNLSTDGHMGLATNMREPHFLAAREASGQQPRLVDAPWCSTAGVPSSAGSGGALVPRLHVLDQVDHTVAVAELVVVP